MISKCGQRVEEKTLHWLSHHDFFLRTGVTPENLHFTRTRDGKAPICERLGITHFIDDRLGALAKLPLEHRYLLNADLKEVRNHPQKILKKVNWVNTWNEILAMLPPPTA